MPAILIHFWFNPNLSQSLDIGCPRLPQNPTVENIISPLFDGNCAHPPSLGPPKKTWVCWFNPIFFGCIFGRSTGNHALLHVFATMFRCVRYCSHHQISMIPEIVVPPNHSFYIDFFRSIPSMLGICHVWKPPFTIPSPCPHLDVPILRAQRQLREMPCAWRDDEQNQWGSNGWYTTSCT